LVTGGAGYIGGHTFLVGHSGWLTKLRALGSHVVFALQETRRYKVVCIDNYHNSYPKALKRLEELARNALPPNPTELEKESTVIDKYMCDLTNPIDVRAVFEKYGKGGFWGVIHIAVCFFAPRRSHRGRGKLS